MRDLWSAMDFRFSEVLRFDLCWALAAGFGGLATALITPAAMIRTVPIAASLVGVVVGAVIAGIAVQTAFMDQAFLRKIKAIGRDPARYIAPFLFTAFVGIIAMLSMLVLSAMSAKTLQPILAIACFISSFLTVWTMGSLLQALSTLVQFIHLKVDALDVPDDIDLGNPVSK
ncbi:hypothetical protein [Actinoplanes sp. GCM10030250]|uniref:hypothetical protein n=1 Tax=Actinoplanes sp. GCM10030250 TaxID=3273376 RepID=UPI00361E0138